MRVRFLLVLTLVLAAFLAVAGLTSAATTTVQLTAQNNSGITGTATLEDVAGGKTKVTLKLTGTPAGVAEPAHIHNGTCANLNPTPKYPLTNVSNGASETTVDVSVADLTSQPFAINVHKSPQEAAVYVSCGNITATAAGAAPSAAPRTGGGGMAGQRSPLPWVAAAGLLAVLALGGVRALRRRT